MALWGTIINAAAIIVGGLLGLMLNRLSQGIRSTVMQGIGLALVALGLSMTLKSTNFLLIVASLVLGGLLGELLRVERNLEALGRQLERMVNALSRFIRRRSRGGKHSELADLQSEAQVQGRIAAGFVNTTLIYCVGAMAILGSLDSGLRGQHDILYVKAMMDGFLTVIFASTMGVGVLFSAISVFLYQGAIALAASGIASLVDKAALDEIIMQITAVGGVLIMGIGINLLELRKINVANLLPSVLVAALAVPFVHWISTW
ncbi:DUF554 domain-containing protein [Paenibacillus sp. FSL H7-0331]|uniref:DUF554 domain-containing protein n=1 Tax=Paenibacillus sp. FSL H7-0331 TaxID=1920421 RepID=UPI00096D909F|nr:DUF554 domain-containing protein [Paenibacillus sp. FSL H7-0331]OMF16213.1 hypothetical protein BK127_12300 [Paenibacillus sp. FSL H7-0331]